MGWEDDAPSWLDDEFYAREGTNNHPVEDEEEPGCSRLSSGTVGEVTPD